MGKKMIKSPTPIISNPKKTGSVAVNPKNSGLIPLNQKNGATVVKRKGIASGFLIAVIAVVLIIVGAGFYVAKKFKSWAAEGVTMAMSMIIEESDLPEVEKSEIVEILEIVKTDYLTGDITLEELGQILEAMPSCPAFAMGIVIQFEASYVETSGLSDAEKTEATIALNRFAQGLSNGLIGWEEIEDIIGPISETDEDGEQQLKEPDGVTDNEIREVLLEVKRIADDAGIPEEFVEVDISAAFQATIEEILSRPLA